MTTFKLKSDGREYTTHNQNEITRLRLSRQYEEVGVEPVPTVKDEQFHPEGKTVKEVRAYMERNPQDAARVVSEEKAGQARVTIVGA
jgi:CHAD domain-containing protein